MYFLDLNNEADGWDVYATTPPLVESPSLVHIGKYCVRILYSKSTY